MLGQLDRAGQRFAGLGEHVDEPPRLRLLGGEALAGQRQLERLLIRNALRQSQQPTAGGDQATLDLGDAELGRTRGDHQVGRQHHLGAARQGVAFDGGDQRLARRPLGEADAAAGNRHYLSRGERLQIHPGTEIATGAGEHRDREVGVVVEFVDRVGQSLADRKVHRVARLGAIDGDDQDPALAFRNTASDTRAPPCLVRWYR